MSAIKPAANSFSDLETIKINSGSEINNINKKKINNEIKSN